MLARLLGQGEVLAGARVGIERHPVLGRGAGLRGDLPDAIGEGNPGAGDGSQRRGPNGSFEVLEGAENCRRDKTRIEMFCSCVRYLAKPPREG